MTKLHINHLVISWSTSRGRDTYGYNICRLDDRETGKRYRCNGGGYDMIGKVFGDWLADYYQADLKKIASRAVYHYNKQESSKGRVASDKLDALYGMTANTLGSEVYYVSLDGACGIESMIRIAEAIGLEVQREYNKKGHTVGYYVSREINELEAAQ